MAIEYEIWEWKRSSRPLGSVRHDERDMSAWYAWVQAG